MADGVIDCTGEPEAFNTGVGLLHPGGRYVMVGLTGGRATPAILDHVVRQEIKSEEASARLGALMRP